MNLRERLEEKGVDTTLYVRPTHEVVVAAADPSSKLTWQSVFKGTKEQCERKRGEPEWVFRWTVVRKLKGVRP